MRSVERRSGRVISLLLLAVLTMMAVACAAPRPAKVEEVPIPPAARKDTLEGAYEIKIDLVGVRVLRELREKYRTADAAVYFIAPEAGWESVTAFYQQSLGGMGWQRDASLPTDRTDHKLAVWTSSGWFQKRAVAVAYLDDASPGPGGEDTFLIVFVAGS